MMSTSTPSFEQRAESIALYRPTRYHVHETVFRQMLGFQTQTKASFKKFTDRIQKGGTGGNPKSKDWKPNLEPYNKKIKISDLSVDNELHLHTEKFGYKDGPKYTSLEASPESILCENHYFSFGRFSENNEVVRLRDQIAIVRDVLGTTKGLAGSVAQRRQAQWKLCLEDKAGGEDYEKTDLLCLLDEYGDMLGFDTEDQSSISDQVLTQFKSEIVNILRLSHVLPYGDNISIIRRRTGRNKRTNDDIDAEEVEVQPQKRRSRRSSPVSVEDVPVGTGTPVHQHVPVEEAENDDNVLDPPRRTGPLPDWFSSQENHVHTELVRSRHPS